MDINEMMNFEKEYNNNYEEEYVNKNENKYVNIKINENRMITSYQITDSKEDGINITYELYKEIRNKKGECNVFVKEIDGNATIDDFYVIDIKSSIASDSKENNLIETVNNLIKENKRKDLLIEELASQIKNINKKLNKEA